MVDLHVISYTLSLYFISTQLLTTHFSDQIKIMSTSSYFLKTTDCDRPGAVCQDSPFISGDGIMFYFLVKKDKGFCILSDSKLHINAHFIGKKK